MTRKRLRILVFWLVAALGLTTAQPGLARAFAPGSVCHAGAALDESYAEVAAQPARWTCADDNWPIAEPRTLLRFQLAADAPPPARFVTRLTRFAAMRVTVIGADGRSASRVLHPADMAPATNDWLMSAPLPRLGTQIRTVTIAVDETRHVGMLSDLRLVPDRPETPAQGRGELLIAALCGMLFLPLFFNFAFFRVLRERFLIWHGLAVVCMLAQTLITSGLINRFVDLSLSTLCFASAITWGTGIVAAALFSADYLEPGMNDPLHRRLLRGTAPWVGFWTAFYLLAGGPLRPLIQPLYFASFVLVLALFAWTMLIAVKRGSRAVRFQIVAWMPIMLTGLVRVVTAIGTDAPLELQLEQHVSIALEIIVTSLGVADRFMMIRRQRDFAVSEMRVAEERSERDPMTGLLNRRGLERRFATLRAEGYRAMALVDLDKFKSVNDTYGHVVGDEVLCAAAEALEPDPDTRVVRLGGEEFLLLLRGDEVFHRAERRRQAIATRVAARVSGLDRIVTASMGLVELPAGGGLLMDFTTLYGHCDRLLYEAKHAGRNRTIRERMQSFAGGKVRAA